MVLAAALAGAAPTASAAPRLSIEAALGADGVSYTERSGSGSLLDRETGVAPATAVVVEVSAARWFLRAGAALSGGDLRYAGRTRSADATLDDRPVTTTSGARFAGLEVQGGGWLRPDRLALYGGVAVGTWERDIQGTTAVSTTGVTVSVPGLYEDYAWLELQAGVRWSFLRSERWDWLLDARATAVVAGYLDVGRDPGAVRVDLGEGPGARAALSVRRALAPRWSVALDAHGEATWLTAGARDPESGFREPASLTLRGGLAVTAAVRL